MMIFCIDFETTGLDRASGITEIASLRLREDEDGNGNENTDWFEMLVNPGQSIPLEVQAITGISDSMVKHAAKEKVALEALLLFWTGVIESDPSRNDPSRKGTDCITLIAHNASYDKGILESACARHKIDLPPIQWICTLQMARAYPKWHKKSCTLENCVKRISGSEKITFHRASGDARACALVYAFLKDKDEIKSSKSSSKRSRSDADAVHTQDTVHANANANDEAFHSDIPAPEAKTPLSHDQEYIPCIAAAVCGNYYVDPLTMTRTSGVCNSCSDVLEYHYYSTFSQTNDRCRCNCSSSLALANCIDKLVQSNAALTLLALSSSSSLDNEAVKNKNRKRARSTT